MAEINWNNVYNDYVTQYKDPYKAAEYTIFGRLTGSKKIPTTYTQDEWYKVNAPDYFAIKTYAGTDELNKYTRDELAKSDVKFTKLRDIAKNAKGLGSGYGVDQYYADLVEIWKQKNAAEKSFTTQPGARWWKDYGLKDPSERYNGTVGVDGKVVNPFAPAETYISQQTQAYAKKLGNDPNAQARIADFNNAIRTAVYKKVTDSNITPFLVSAQQRIKARG